ncbi:SCP-like protein [Ancylostoma ceylanicum]|uniref:SCP-like protein n=1 Tax=Ancylostoma ceylanicum TaxID=53326 RepID=A0A0D6LR12_9BILA|nr:SCP-like protein [Ancylostoma ceylanicum]
MELGKTSTGWAVDKKTQYAKPAKTMNQLEYVKNLEDAALRHVSNCERTAPEHDPPVGESFWRGGSGSYQLSHVEAMKQAMKEWWGPLESIGLGDKLDYTAEVQEGPLKYFAIMAHDKATQIGCAAKTCRKQGVTLIDCRYSTTVALDDPIYEVGKLPCKCPAGTVCSRLGGLCEISPTP